MGEGGPRRRAGSGGALFPPGYTGSGRVDSAAPTSDSGTVRDVEPDAEVEVDGSGPRPVVGPDEIGYPATGVGHDGATYPPVSSPPGSYPPAGDHSAAAEDGDDPASHDGGVYEPGPSAHAPALSTQDPYDQDPDPYAQDRYAQGPYDPDLYGQDPYDPDQYAPELYGQDVYGQDQYAPDQYAQDAYGQDPYEEEIGPVDGGGGEPVGRPTRRRRGRWRHPVLAVFLVVALVVILVGGSGILWAVHQINPSGPVGAKVVVTIPAGASSSQIGADLAAAGVIHSGSLFRYYLKVQGDSNLLPGTYLLARNEPYNDVVTTLQAGPIVITDKLVIPEGFTLREIAARVAALPGTHLSAAKFVALSSSGSVRSPLEPAGVDNLEGLLFPATYSIRRTDTETTILEELIGTFDQQATAMHLAAGAAKLHMTPYQLITVASIIQGEAKFDDQFGDVASVIYNRLRAGTPLGTDSTLIYALRRTHPNLDVAKVNLEQHNPYNTRLHKGLPPTPIDNPGIPALAAAITPPHTSLHYFVEVNPNGTLGFARDGAGFNQLVERCRANHLC